MDREIKMRLPDAVRFLPEHQRQARVTAESPSFMRIDRSRFFVRGLLPVRLSDGHEFRFGVWLEMGEEAWTFLGACWERPEYEKVKFEASLANAVPPWDAEILNAPCLARVRRQDDLPYVYSSSQPALQRVLAEPWSRSECEQLLDRVWGRVNGASRPG